MRTARSLPTEIFIAATVLSWVCGGLRGENVPRLTRTGAHSAVIERSAGNLLRVEHPYIAIPR